MQTNYRTIVIIIIVLVKFINTKVKNNQKLKMWKATDIIKSQKSWLWKKPQSQFYFIIKFLIVFIQNTWDLFKIGMFPGGIFTILKQCLFLYGPIAFY